MSGALDPALLRVPGKKPRICDYDLAVQLIRENTDLTTAPQRAPPSTSPRTDRVSEPMNIAEGAEAQKFWQAKLAELKFRKEAKELVQASEVEAEWAKLLGEVRSKLLGVPTRVKQAAPHLTVADVVLVESLIREALLSVGEP